jgi:FkbM family methyltransferase
MRVVKAHFRGIELALPAEDNPALIRELQTCVYERPLFDEFCCRVAHACHTPEHVVIDVGAHVGAYSISAARLGARVIAIEPNPRVAELLHDNARRNGVASMIEVLAIALGAQDTRLALNVSVQPCAAHIERERGLGPIVDVRTLDGIVRARGVRAGVVKIDAEGMDLDILQGGQETLARHDPWVAAELHPHAMARLGRSAGELLTFVIERCRTRRFLAHESLDPPVDLAACAPSVLAHGGNLLLSDWQPWNADAEARRLGAEGV